MIIVTDIACDLPNEICRDGVVFVERDVKINNQSLFFDQFSKSDMERFYVLLNKSEQSSTEALKYSSIYNTINECSQKDDVLAISFSQKMSATGGLFQKACANIKSNNSIYYYDSSMCSLGEGLIVYYAKKYIDRGLPAKIILNKLDNVKNNIRFFIILDNNNNMNNGGRSKNNLTEDYYSLLELKPNELFSRVGYFLTKDLMKDFVFEKIKQDKPEEVFLAHGSNTIECEKFGDRINTITEHVFSDTYSNPFMGIHCGDGLLLIAYINDV